MALLIPTRPPWTALLPSSYEDGATGIYLPDIAFHHHLDDISWGKPLPSSTRIIHTAVTATAIVIQLTEIDATFDRACLQAVPLVIGCAFATSPARIAIVIEVECAYGPLVDPDQYALINDDTSIEIRMAESTIDRCIDSVVEISPVLLEIDAHLTELHQPDGDKGAGRSQRIAFCSAGRDALLVIGAAGIGKSTMIRCLAAQSSLHYRFIDPYDDDDDQLALSSPSVLVIDDLDEWPVGRPFPRHINNVIFMIGIVEDASILHHSLVDRFPRRLSLSAPTRHRRSTLIAHLHPHLEKDQCDRLAAATPGLLLRDLARLNPDQSLLAAAATHRPFGGYLPVRLRLESISRQWVDDRAGCLVSGVLLYGPSGCGKTLLALHLAANPALNFISIRASDVFSSYLGDSEARLRQLFSRARRSSPCVLFLDDVDALGARRDHDDDGDGGVRARVLSTLLNELDGVVARDGVFMLAATNRIDRIDGALLRPGRFDVHLEMALPNDDDRVEIIKACSAMMPLGHDVDMMAMARRCGGWTGARIDHLVARSGLSALRRHSQTVDAADFNTAFQVE